MAHVPHPGPPTIAAADGVTLYAGFVFTVLERCRGMERLCAPIFELTRDLDRADPYARVPLGLYNEVCDWIEQNLGAASLRDVGRAVGGQVFEHMRSTDAIPKEPTPRDVMEELTRAVQDGVQDPRQRGWELVDAVEGRIVMRCTQAFNCVMQEGMLLTLVEPCGVLMPRVDQRQCTRTGASHCEYDVRWLVKRASRTLAPVRG